MFRKFATPGIARIRVWIAALFQLNISLRLALAFGVLLVLVITLGIFSVIQLGLVKNASNEISGKWMAGVRLTSQMNTDASNFRIAEVKHILATDEEEKKQYEKELSTFARAIEQLAVEYAKNVSSEEEEKLFAEFKRERQRYIDEHARMMRLSTAGQQEDAKALLTYNSQKKYEGASTALRRLVDYNISGGQRASDVNDKIYLLAKRWILVALLCAIFLGGCLAFLISRSITRPLTLSVSVADAVARGDLTISVPKGSSDETGRLLRSLQQMTASLETLVKEVRLSSEQVATSSEEIAMGNADLSQRTEEQAAQLQHISSSMIELNDAVRAIDESALDAVRLASDASGLARKGGVVMESVVDTMSQIADSSEKIGSITELINGISFKTNILALNAAVEAARAGEAGRGFAVVADEVRELAQSSAQAAKDIKALSLESKERVQAGGTLVSQAGSAMSEISEQINSVNDVIARISAATGVQSRNIAQVSEAVSQLDRATQQNAALVEESAAASESLKEQAHQLVGAIAVFKTDV